MEEVSKAFKETHSPREIAISFSIGVFITTMPTMGLGFLLFIVLIKASSKISPIAIFSSALVINPFIKPVFYLASIRIGNIITKSTRINTSDAFLLIKQLYIGSAVIGLLLAIISYFVILKAVKKYREEELEVLEEIGDEIAEKVLK